MFLIERNKIADSRIIILRLNMGVIPRTSYKGSAEVDYFSCLSIHALIQTESPAELISTHLVNKAAISKLWPGLWFPVNPYQPFNLTNGSWEYSYWIINNYLALFTFPPWTFSIVVWSMGLIYELFATPCKHPHILVLGWEWCILKNNI